MRRLLDAYGAPRGAGWQILRVTYATYLCNAIGIYGTASPFMESRQLGHSITVAERHCAGLIRGIPIEARDLETALQIEDLCAQVVKAVQAAPEPATGLRHE
jgi:hypothetical protein